MTATELAAELPISRQAVATHLTVLLTPAGRADRGGSLAAVRSSTDNLAAAGWINDTAAAWDTRLGRLEERLWHKRQSG